MSGLTRRSNSTLQEIAPIDLDVAAAVSATTTFPIATVERDYVITQCEIAVPGGYVQDATNYYVFTLQTHTGTVLATWSTLTGQQGTLTTLQFANLVLAANPTGAAGDQLDIVCTKHNAGVNVNAQTRFRVHLRLL